MTAAVTGAADRLTRIGRRGPMATPRFLTLADVADILNVSWRQVYALVRRKELLAIQIGGRGQWRVEAAELERFIAQRYDEARAGNVPHEPEIDATAETGSPRRPPRGRSADRVLGTARHHRDRRQRHGVHGSHGRCTPRFAHWVL